MQGLKLTQRRVLFPSEINRRSRYSFVPKSRCTQDPRLEASAGLTQEKDTTHTSADASSLTIGTAPAADGKVQDKAPEEKKTQDSRYHGKVSKNQVPQDKVPQGKIAQVDEAEYHVTHTGGAQGNKDIAVIRPDDE